jgi:putative transposase
VGKANGSREGAPEFNPVKQGHVARVADWPHSSFHRHVEHGLLAEDWGGDMREIQGSFGE